MCCFVSTLRNCVNELKHKATKVMWFTLKVVILGLAQISLFRKNLLHLTLIWLCFKERKKKIKEQKKTHGNRTTLVQTVKMCHNVASLPKPFGLSQDVVFPCIYAISSQNIITRATNRKSRDRNCSSMCCGVPGAAVWEIV